ncbi:MAG: LTA synthase family protein [Herbinix sp.]|nr:LTA synthase family protein [Herbinix sp.]
MKKLKVIIASPYFIAFLFIFKMMVYYTLINVNNMEIVLIILSLIVWSTIFICFGRSGLKRKRLIFLMVYFLFSLLMFSDTMYYNYYNQTVSIKQLWQAKSVAAVPKSFIATLIPASFLLFIDIPFAYLSFKKYATKENFQKWLPWRKFKYVIYVLTAVFITMITNPFHTAAFERVNSMEFFTNHVNDICETITENLSKEDMDQEEILGVLNEVTPEAEATRYNGIGKGKNLIVIQLEAFQNFVLGATYEGQEITPNLNRLMQEDTLYYDHYFSNIGKGNTADAEFSSLNSLYPIIDGESYRIYQDNTFNGLPWLMRDNGYYSFAIHGYEGSFWNREYIYPKLGFQEFYSMEDLKQDEIIGLGVSDKSMFKQLIPIIQKQTQPFFTFAITLTNHHPFILDEKYHTLTLAEEDKGTKFGGYLETVRYTDEAIGQLINDLKAAGLYENTVIALYGDHHGLNCGMEDVSYRVGEFIGRIYDYDEMLNIPLIIHVPGSDVKKTISTTGGQIDFMPTIANVMGLSYDNTFVMGQDLTNAKNGFVAFTSYLFDGSFASGDIIFEISREGIFEGSRAWKIGTNEQVDATRYKEEYDKALLLKKTSKEIMDQNLIANFITH